MLSFVVLFAATAAWSLATPLGSGPDEPAHLIRAASVARGQFLGTPYPGPAPAMASTTTVDVPQVFARLANDVGCFQFKPTVTARCQGSLAGSRADVPVYTYVGRYPPLYYALVGLPTLVASPTGMYLARLASGALSAAMLALAMVSLRRCRGTPLLAAGLSLAITPMALYLASVVNPSGLEISSAISAWAAAMAIASGPPEAVPAGTFSILGASTVVLVLTRALSPLWASAVIAALVLLSPSARRLGRRRGAQIWLATVALAGAGALAWDLLANPFVTQPGIPLPAGTSAARVLLLSVDRFNLLATSAIGKFDWLDVPSPWGVTVLWLGALALTVLLGLVFARRRGRLVLTGTVIASFILPLALIASQARHSGILGQGRDFLPLAVGIPIVAAAVAGERPGGRRALVRSATLVTTALAAGQVADFYATLRTDTVGITGPLNAFANPPDAWHPPVPAFSLFIVFALAMAAYVFVLRAASLAQPAAVAAAGLAPVAEGPVTTGQTSTTLLSSPVTPGR